jgi:DNA-binding response OmpR family regulator
VRAKGKRILVVDDEVPIQRILRRNLTVSGYDVLVADNGKQAVEMTRLHQPDLILLDICMPGELDGLDVCMQVRDFTPIPIIILSAVGEEKEKVKALDLGADDYLTKPFSNDELQARVRACMRRAGAQENNADSEPGVLVSEDGYIHMDVPSRQVRKSTDSSFFITSGLGP